MDFKGELSGLTEAQLRDWLGAVRRIAALDDHTALRELDGMAFGLTAAVQHAEDDIGEELGRAAEAGRERLKQDLASARANLEHPSRIGPFDGLHLMWAMSDEVPRQRRHPVRLACRRSPG